MRLFATSVKLQEKAGLKSRLYQANELQKLVPHINAEGLEGGLFGPDDGFLDPYEMCTFLAAKVRTRGGEIRQFCRIVGVKRRNGGLHVGDGQRRNRLRHRRQRSRRLGSICGKIVRAITLICPERHEAIVIHLDQPLDYTMPMVMDLVNGEGTGLNFRYEKRDELIAEIHKVSSPAPEDPDNYNDQCDERAKVRLAELLLDRLPELPGARVGRGWAGLYPISAGHRLLVGPIDPSEPTLVTAAGAGGYGIQLGPVIGQIAADWTLHGAPVSAPGTEILAPTIDRNAPPASIS